MSVVSIVALKSPIQSNHCSGFPSITNGLTIGIGLLKVFETFCWLLNSGGAASCVYVTF